MYEHGFNWILIDAGRLTDIITQDIRLRKTIYLWCCLITSIFAVHLVSLSVKHIVKRLHIQNICICDWVVNEYLYVLFYCYICHVLVLHARIYLLVWSNSFSSQKILNEPNSASYRRLQLPSRVLKMGYMFCSYVMGSCKNSLNWSMLKLTFVMLLIL